MQYDEDGDGAMDSIEAMLSNPVASQPFPGNISRRMKIPIPMFISACECGYILHAKASQSMSSSSNILHRLHPAFTSYSSVLHLHIILRKVSPYFMETTFHGARYETLKFMYLAYYI